MEDITIKYLSTPPGELILGSWNEQLCLCDWRYRRMREKIDRRVQEGLSAGYVEGDSPVIDITQQQLEEYFRGERTIFDIPLKLVGTEFQFRVWNELQRIPYGRTESYLALSNRLGDERAIRAVASANGANAISIIIPCHRIIGNNGDLVGYAGGLNAKKELLRLENRGERPEQLDLFE